MTSQERATQSHGQDTTAQPSHASSGCEVSATNFIQEVMDPSESQLVILAFWAPWCEPCKQLAPFLERAVALTEGAAKLTRIDIDKNAQIAEQLHVQSVPTVFAFFNRQLIDGFMGVLPESQISEWLRDLIVKTGAKAQDIRRDIDEAIAQATTCLDEDEAATALAIFSSVLEKEPLHEEAFCGFLKSYLALGENQKAHEILENAPKELASSKKLVPLRVSIDLAREAGNTEPSAIGPLLQAIEANANNHQARFDLALAYYAQNDTAQAIASLLEIVKRDRQWHEDAARLQLVKIFESLGHSHPQTIDARKQLSTLLFS